MTSPALTPAEVLLARLRGQGCVLYLDFHAEGMTPRIIGTLTDADRAALARHREALGAVLLAEARAAAAARERLCGADGAALERAVCWETRRKETRG